MVGQDCGIRECCLKHNELSTQVTLRPEVLALISDVKNAGLKFGILTNELELFHGENWLETMPFANQVDAVVDATRTKILKPDPRSYALALDSLALAADEVVFIDDQPRNNFWRRRRLVNKPPSGYNPASGVRCTSSLSLRIVRAMGTRSRLRDAGLDFSNFDLADRVAALSYGAKIADALPPHWLTLAAY